MLRKNYAFFDKLSKTSQKDTLEQQEVENYMTVAFYRIDRTTNKYKNMLFREDLSTNFILKSFGI